MSTHLVVTIIARDGPGIVEQLSQAIAQAGGSWLGSRMTRLAGEFAGIVEIRVPDAASEALIDALNALDAHGMRLQVQRSTPLADGDDGTYTLNFELTGDDRPGIVSDVSQTLASRRVNVHELVTRVESAAMSGHLLFRASARLEVPNEVAPEELAQELEKIAPDVIVDLTLDT